MSLSNGFFFPSGFIDRGNGAMCQDALKYLHIPVQGAVVIIDYHSAKIRMFPFKVSQPVCYVVFFTIPLWQNVTLCCLFHTDVRAANFFLFFVRRIYAPSAFSGR